MTRYSQIFKQVLHKHQLQLNAVQTPAAVPPSPVTLKSTKLPAATGTLPVAVQLAPVDTVQASSVLTMLPGVPCRNVTVIVLACSENTVSVVAVQPEGTHVSTDWPSLALALLLFTE